MALDQFAISYVHRDLISGNDVPAPAPVAAADPPTEAADDSGIAGGLAADADQAVPPVADIDEPCVPKYSEPSSRPGVPCMKRVAKTPYKTETPWRSELGERVLKAVGGRVDESACGGFQLFGDSVWCLKVMKEPGVLALSYGIEERDMWSEKMSNIFKMPTRLYDCFIPPRLSPPIAGTAPNGTSCAGVGGPCYETPYEAYRICLGPTRGMIGEREYVTLQEHLAGRPPLSTHLKIDTEGTEWDVLEQFLASPEDQDKVRTLEMEVHFSYSHEGNSAASGGQGTGERKQFERRVGIMERLLERFACLGTNLEVYQQGWTFDKRCPKSSCDEPPIHITRGMSMDQFAVSYVNRKLLSDGPASPASGGESLPPPPSPVAPTPAPPEEEEVACSATYASKSSRPGFPCMPRMRKNPFRADTPWRTELGERVLKAVAGSVTEQECDGFELFGDHTWCLRAMREKGVLGFSYGIEERDRWSEMMSNLFKMETRLYDCFIPPERSPPIARTAPNATQSCQGVGYHCYETPYQSFRICLGPEAATKNGRKYETLAQHLDGRPPLSTHLKIDSEGTEWSILERFLESAEEQDKVRTLEMEVHFSFVHEGDSAAVGSQEERELIESRVRILERLLERFACTGTTLEVYQEGWSLDEKCPDSSCEEPPLHLRHGMSMDQFAVSYVNKALLQAKQ